MTGGFSSREKEEADMFKLMVGMVIGAVLMRRYERSATEKIARIRKFVPVKVDAKKEGKIAWMRKK
jgi:hypothetical protein